MIFWRPTVFSMPQALPQAMSSAAIEIQYVSKNTLQFKMSELVLKIDWIGEPSRWLMLNGRIFSRSELSSYIQFKKALYAKFGVSKKSRKTAGILSFFIPKAQAQDATAPYQVDEFFLENGVDDQVVIESQEGRTES